MIWPHLFVAFLAGCALVIAWTGAFQERSFQVLVLLGLAVNLSHTLGWYARDRTGAN